MDSDSPEGLPPLPTFDASERVCGNCKLWRPYQIDHRGWVGPCRLQPQRSNFPPTAPICNAFVGKGTPAGTQPAPAPPRTPRRSLQSVAPVVVKRRRDPHEVVDLGGELNMTREELMDLFREASGDGEPPPLAAKWQGGVIQLIPGSKDLQAKELPVDALFHKVVMVRDRLRTLEQKINGNSKLNDAEKVELQQYITRVYGSLTSFNHLFRDKDDYFVGAKSDE